ncbi:dUTP diphosphatase [Pedobacter sp. HDW13]|uniref:dUTP diphosphatase n=1 Tax=Pedobacter sp. HDW13 TaxID=2714940 RepID=UPI00351B923E
MFPRSSIYKFHQTLTNSVGVIDSGYRGEVSAIMLANIPNAQYKIGERAAQLVILPYPEIELIEADELSETERGDGGFGSSGK